MTIVAFEKEVSLKILILFSKTMVDSTVVLNLKKKTSNIYKWKKKFKRILVEGETFKLRKLPSKDFC